MFQERPSFDLGINTTAEKSYVFDGGGSSRDSNIQSLSSATHHRSASAPSLGAFNGFCRENPIVAGQTQIGGVGFNSSFTGGFIDIDSDLEKEVEECGENRSKKKDDWARKRFDEYRQHVSVDDSIAIEDLGLKEFAGMLEGFFKQVVKRNGSFYPSASLMNMFRCFGRILRRAQECRIAETGVEEIPLDICSNVHFRKAKYALEASMNRSVKAGANVRTKKSEVVPVVDELKMLADSECSVTHPVGLQRRFLYFCLSRFCIRGGVEVWNIQVGDFKFGEDSLAAYLEYNERLSKNYKVSVKRYQESDFRAGVKIYDGDVVSTTRELFRRLPKVTNSAVDMQFILLQAIRNPLSEIWYSKARMSQRSVSKLVQSLCGRVGLTGYFSNKSLRMTAVSRMSLAEVPIDVGMQVTGHRRADNYKKYDATCDLKLAAAQSILSSPLDAAGNPRKFSSVYEQHVSQFCKLSGSSSGCVARVDRSESPLQKLKKVDAAGCSSDQNRQVNSAGLTCPSVGAEDDATLKMIEKEWPEGAKALSLGSNSSLNSMFNGAVFNNCVVNVYGCGSGHGFGSTKK